MTEERGPRTEEMASKMPRAEVSKPLPRSSFLVRPTVVALAVASLTGCHRYEPVTAATVAHGSLVAVSLTDQGTANLGRLLGMGVGTVEGSLVTASDSAYTLSVQLVRQRDGMEAFWKGEQVTIPRVDVAEIRRRRLSRSKSALATVALIAAAVGAVEAFIGTGSASQPPGGPGNGGPR
jgi:hypothetical protein